jgi:hypothetical protein
LSGYEPSLSPSKLVYIVWVHQRSPKQFQEIGITRNTVNGLKWNTIDLIYMYYDFFWKNRNIVNEYISLLLSFGNTCSEYVPSFLLFNNIGIDEHTPIHKPCIVYININRKTLDQSPFRFVSVNTTSSDSDVFGLSVCFDDIIMFTYIYCSTRVWWKSPP